MRLITGATFFKKIMEIISTVTKKVIFETYTFKKKLFPAILSFKYKN